jgi:ANTAR domain/PAS fold
MRDRSDHWPTVGSFRYTAADDRWEWSDEVARMHGYPGGAMNPSTAQVLSHKHPADKTTVAELIDEVRRHGVAFSSRHRIIDTDGEEHVVVVVGDLLYDNAGAVCGTHGFYVDFTDQFNNDLQQALTEAVVAVSERRAVINQAIGILIARHGVSAQRCFGMLTDLSQASNVKLRDLAERFVERVRTAEVFSPAGEDLLDRLLESSPWNTVGPDRRPCGQADVFAD